ncbi:MAG: DUF5808 domain-containing protein, partial [Planctomycetota bacterium]
ILPLITRKGLLFGAYVGEEFAEGDAARGLRRRWYLGCLMLIVLSLAVGLGISLAGWPVAGNLTATAILLLSGLGLYLRMYYTARGLAPPAAARQAEVAAAPLADHEPSGTAFAKLALGICILAGLATVVYAMVSYDDMPHRLPAPFGASGEADGRFNKSIVGVMLVPSLNLVLSPFFALLALLTARAKRSVRGGSGGRSLEAQDAFRAAVANAFSVTALLICALMTLLSVQLTRLGLSQIRSLGAGIWVIAGAMLVFMFGCLIWIVTRYGQGGALIEEGSAEAPLTNGLADNAHWLWGVFYVNRNDPSILVEKRFGFGYTFNYGNRKAVVLVVTVLVLILVLTTLGLIEAIS